MADFKVREIEGMRQVVIDLHDETIRARRGALSNIRGDIRFTPRLPRAADIFRSAFNREGRIRPFYSGTGTVHLQPSLRGYHVFDTQAEDRWILEPQVYWASEGSVDLGFFRERMFASLWAGDGFLVWKTTLQGHGRVAINAPGPVEEVDVHDTEMRVQGRLVLGRTSGLKFSSQRAARFPRNLISGQNRMRVFTGTGKLLMCMTPYWNQFMYERMTGEAIEGSIFE